MTSIGNLSVYWTFSRNLTKKGVFSFRTPSTSCTLYVYQVFNDWNYSKRADMIEQTGLLILIVGRWLLPQGSYK